MKGTDESKGGWEEVIVGTGCKGRAEIKERSRVSRHKDLLDIMCEVNGYGAYGGCGAIMGMV